jgi:dTDP-4-amino-4,6-dideoxygalactose transaminase
MSENIPFARPYIGKEEEEAVLRVLRSGWLTTAGETLAFEQEFSSVLMRPPFPHAVSGTAISALAVNSATSGLHLALEACGVGPGDLVLVPSYTFTSTAEVVRYLGADVVFVDVAPGTFHLDPNALEAALQRLSEGLSPYPDGSVKPHGQAKAVIPVHYGGLPCDMEAIMAIARRYGLRVIEDAAHSFPAHLDDGRWAGTIGDVGVFSFYATKTITTGEGGMMVSRDPELLRRLGVLRSHGIDRSVWNRYTDTGASWYYEVVEAGYKYNLPDLLSALGRVQLSRAFDLLEMRRDIARSYDRAFGAHRCFSLPPTGPGDARHLYPLRLEGLSRDDFIVRMQEAGVGVSVHFIPLHTMPYYRKRYGLADDALPETMRSFQQEVSLPIWPGMTASQVERVISTVFLPVFLPALRG